MQPFIIDLNPNPIFETLGIVKKTIKILLSAFQPLHLYVQMLKDNIYGHFYYSNALTLFLLS